MRRSVIILFILGLLFEIAAFIGGHADSIPFVLQVISPSYVRAKQGLKNLDTDMTLSPDELGFAEISRVFLERLAKDNPPEKLANISIIKIYRKRAYLGIGRKRAGEVIPITFVLSNGQEIDWKLKFLSPLINELKSKRVFLAAVIVFMAGVSLQIIGFILQLKASPQDSKDTNKRI
jgi:hypothetical protein